jgi:hypothetical protein
LLRTLLYSLTSSLLLVGGCAEIKNSTNGNDNGGTAPPGEENGEQGTSFGGGTSSGSANPPANGSTSGGTSGTPNPGGPITVDDLVTGRTRLGARSSEGFRPWRTGLTVNNGKVYWVESGAAPGLYSAPVNCTTPATCAVLVTAMTRASAFTATQNSIFFADTTVLKRVDLTAAGASTPVTVASAAKDILNIATDGVSVFWTFGTDSAIRQTPIAGGSTSTPIFSNGTPVAMGRAGSRIYWTGVDISGQSGAIQSVGTNGMGAREVSRFANGFYVFGGNATYMYYAKDSPTTIHRITLATNHDDVVGTDAMGVTDIFVDDTFAYWVEPGDGPDYANGQVRRVAHDQKTPETLAISVRRPLAVAVEGKKVYVASAGTGTAWSDGKILRINLP